MRKDRHAKRKFHSKSLTLVLAISLAFVLVVSCSVGATLAWLTHTSETVTNTFTYGDINITLTETESADADINPEDDANSLENTYKMIPGSAITKDPTVTVKAGSEKCWLFIKVETDNNPGNYLDYTIDDRIWEELDAMYPGVYCYKGTELDQLLTEDKTYNILTDNKVTVKSTVTKEQMTAIGENYPTLTFTAYAIQKAHFDTAEDAWDEISTNP